MTDDFFNCEAESETIIAGAMRLAALISGYLRTTPGGEPRGAPPGDLIANRETILREAFGENDPEERA